MARDRKRPLPVGVRLLDSGKYQAIVRMPDGTRDTSTHRLMSLAVQWRIDRLAEIGAGDARDSRAGRVKVGVFYERWIAARGGVPSTLRKVRSLWDTHCEPQWAKWPMDAIGVLEAQAWVNELKAKRRARHKGRNVEAGEESPTLGADTVHQAVNMMSSLYSAAMRERPPLVRVNPFIDLDLPEIPPAPVDFLSRDEADAIIAAARELRPGQGFDLLIEMGTWMALRPGELYGLVGNRIDWLRRQVHVTHVMTRDGLRDYPKTRKSFRTVPMPRAGLVDELAAMFHGRDRDGLVWRKPEGGDVDDAWFRQRVWEPARIRAKVRPCSPRIMRHTGASHLVIDGVPLYHVQILLGHESFSTTQRYAHLIPGAHDLVRGAWAAAQHQRAGHPGDVATCARCKLAAG